MAITQDALSPENLSLLRSQRLNSLIEQADLADDQEAVMHLTRLKGFMASGIDEAAKATGNAKIDYVEAVNALRGRRTKDPKNQLPTSFDKALGGEFHFKGRKDTITSMMRDIVNNGSDSEYYIAPLENLFPTASAISEGDERTEAIRNFKSLRESGRLHEMPFRQRLTLANMFAHQKRSEESGLMGQIGDTMLHSGGEMAETVAAGGPLGLLGMPVTGALRGGIRGSKEPYTYARPVLDKNGNVVDIDTDLAMTEGEVDAQAQREAVRGGITSTVEAFGGKLAGKALGGVASKIPGKAGEVIRRLVTTSGQTATNRFALSGIAGELSEEEIEPALQWVASSLQDGEITQRQAGLTEDLLKGIAGDEEALKRGIAGYVTVGAMAGPVEVANAAPSWKQVFSKQGTQQDVEQAVSQLTPVQLKVLSEAVTRSKMQEATGEKQVGSAKQRKAVAEYAKREYEKRSQEEATQVGSAVAPEPEAELKKSVLKKKSSPGVGILYRETDLEGLSTLVGDMQNYNPFISDPSLFFADNQDIAIGQGTNKGVMIEVDSTGLDVREHKKPGTAIPGFGKEYKVDPGKGGIADNIRSVTIDPTQSASPPMMRRMGNWLINNGWKPEFLPDGRAKYTNPKYGDENAQGTQQAESQPQPPATDEGVAAAANPEPGSAPVTIEPARGELGQKVRPEYQAQPHQDQAAGVTIQPLPNPATTIQQAAKDLGRAFQHLAPEMMDERAGNALGYYNTQSKEFVLNRDVTPQAIYRIVSHEFAHGMDFESEGGNTAAGDLLARMVTVNSQAETQFAPAIQDSTTLQDQVHELQRYFIQYEGDQFQRYQRSPSEQAADLIATFITDPGLVQQMAPDAYALVKSKIETDKGFRDAYRGLMAYVEHDYAFESLRENVQNSLAAGIEATRNQMQAKKSIFRKKKRTPPISAILGDRTRAMEHQALRYQKKRGAKRKGEAIQKSSWHQASGEASYAKNGMQNRVNAVIKAVDQAKQLGVSYEELTEIANYKTMAPGGARADVATMLGTDVRGTPLEAQAMLDRVLLEMSQTENGTAKVAAVNKVMDGILEVTSFQLDQSLKFGGISPEQYAEQHGKFFLSREDRLRKIFQGRSGFNTNAAITGSTTGSEVGDLIADTLGKSVRKLAKDSEQHVTNADIELLSSISQDESQQTYAKPYSVDELTELAKEQAEPYSRADIDEMVASTDNLSGLSESLGIEGKLVKANGKIYAVPEWYFNMVMQSRARDFSKTNTILWGVGKLNNNQILSQAYLATSPTFGVNELTRTTLGAVNKLYYDVSPTAAREVAKRAAKDITLILAGQKSLGDVVKYNRDVGLPADVYRSEIGTVDHKTLPAEEAAVVTLKELESKEGLDNWHNLEDINAISVITGGIVSQGAFIPSVPIRAGMAIYGKAREIGAKVGLPAESEVSEAKRAKIAEWFSQKASQGLLLTHIVDNVTKKAAVEVLIEQGFTPEQAVTYVRSEIGNPEFTKSDVSEVLGVLSPFSRAKAAGLMNLYNDTVFGKQLAKKAIVNGVMTASVLPAAGMLLHGMAGMMLGDDDRTLYQRYLDYSELVTDQPDWGSNGSFILPFWRGSDESGEDVYQVTRIHTGHEYAWAAVFVSELQRAVFQHFTKPEGKSELAYWGEHALTATNNALKQPGITAVGPAAEAIAPAFMGKMPGVNVYDTYKEELITPDDPEKLGDYWARKLFGQSVASANSIYNEMIGQQKRSLMKRNYTLGPVPLNLLPAPSVYEFRPGEKAEWEYANEQFQKDGKDISSFFSNSGLGTHYEKTRGMRQGKPETAPSRRTTGVQQSLKKAYYNAHMAPLDDIRREMLDYGLSPAEPEAVAVMGNILNSARDEGKRLGVTSTVKPSDVGEGTKNALADLYTGALRTSQTASNPLDREEWSKVAEVYGEALTRSGEDISDYGSLVRRSKQHENFRKQIKMQIRQVAQRKYQEQQP